MTPIARLRLICASWLLLATAACQAQVLNPRWHGHWEGSDGGSLSINAKSFSTEDLKDCKWASSAAASAAEKGCTAAYNGTINKAQLLRLQKQFSDSIDDAVRIGGASERPVVQERIRRNQALLDEIGNETFRIVIVAEPVPEEQFSGDSGSFFFLSENTIYRVTECEPCVGDHFRLVAYARVTGVGPAVTTQAPPLAPALATSSGATRQRAPEPPASAAQARPAGGYKSVNYTDFLLDHGKMAGERIRIKASIQSFSNIAFLRRNELDTNPIHLEFEELPREDRRKILTLCQHVTCAGVFYGRVEKSLMGPRIKLERVEWQGGAGLVDKLGNILGR